jgi:uncharacterized membrane protein HdeD (DUF308 family)
MSMNPSVEEVRAFRQALREHSTMFMVEGVILVILGILAIALTPIASLAVTIIIGWLFLASGVIGLIATFMGRNAPGVWWSLLSALLALVVGVVLLIMPVSGVITLTLLLVAFFLVEGILSVMYALEHRNDLPGRWGWMLASGIVDLIIAGLVFAGLPGSAAWAIGLLVGINMLMGGAALIGMSLHARELSP